MTNQQRTWTQEFRLQSNDPGSRLKWTVGTFWSLAAEDSASSSSTIRTSIISSDDLLRAVTADSIFGPYSYNCPSDPANSYSAASFPNCDIYFNHNKSYDRQIAGFGEATYKITDQLSLTVGARDTPSSASRWTTTQRLRELRPRARRRHRARERVHAASSGSISRRTTNNLFYATYAKGFRPGGYNPPLLPVFCGPGLIADGFPSGRRR